MAKLKRQRFCEECEVDRISLLPDEVLVSILCLLSFKEATATSILGRRWRYLHTWTRKLDFDGTKSIEKLRKINTSMMNKYSLEECCYRSKKFVDEERVRYAEWVDSLISTRRSSTLDEFRLFFGLDWSSSWKIDEWLRFALSRRVEKLDLNLTFFGELQARAYKNSYIFPHHAVRFDQLKMLKKLSLNCVNITGEFVKGVVRNCRCLEELSFTYCDIEYVEIVDPSPSFKSLLVCICHNLKSVVIRNSNVVSLKVHLGKDRIRDFVLENVPQFSEFWCWLSRRTMSMVDIRRMIRGFLPQLCVLKLFTSCHNLGEEDFRNFCSGVELSNLKELVVLHDNHSLSPLINLLNASPRLERFVVGQVQVDKHSTLGPEYPIPGKIGRIPKKYPCLKELKIAGYHGLYQQLEMVVHLVENGVALEDIVVDPRPYPRPVFGYSSWDFIPRQKISPEEEARHAFATHQLSRYVPSRINIKIL